MQTIVAPIKPGESGPEVDNLQAALLALLEREIIKALDAPDRPTKEELQRIAEGLKGERDRSTFGASTVQLLMYFQIQQGLGDNLRDVGVDEKTAAKLNQLLKKLGLLEIVEPDGFIVRGTVSDSDGQPVSGAVVRAFDRDMRKKPPVGDAETNVQGQFIIRYGPSQFASGDEPTAPGPSLIVRAFTGDQQIGPDVTLTKPTRDEVVDFTLSTPTVSEWERLSAAITPLLKGQGENDQNLPPWDLSDSDLTFIVEETGLEREQIRLWALAFAVGRDAAAVMQPATVTSLVAGVATSALLHPLITKDMSAFAIFYGWFRLGLPSEPGGLWATPTETLLTTLSTAIERGIVPSSAGADLDSLRKRIEQVKLDRVLQAPTLGTGARLGDLLATLPVPLNVDQARAIAATAPELRPDDPNLVNRIADISGLERNAAVGVAHTLRLGALTGGYLPLAQALQDRLQSAGESDGTLRPLAALRPDEWLDLAYTHGVPEGMAITPVAYADALAASVEQQHPTAALAAHFTDGRRLAQHPALTDVGTFLRDNTDFDIVTANLNAVIDEAKLDGVPEPQHAQVVDGLRALQRMKVLGASWDETAALLENDLYSPHQLLAAGPTQLTALLGDRIAPERITALYTQAQELHNVTFAAFTAAFSPLSAPRILAMNQFITPPSDPPNPEDLGGVVPLDLPPGGDVPHTADPAGNVKLKDFADALAHHLANRDMALDPGWGRVVPSARGGVVIPDKTPQLDLSPFIDHQPTLQALFGSQDACACGHCNSVLSPAAYFVDVLQFIKNGEINGRLLDALLKRRPDLQDIELSCNNTNSEVPAIDLALEILENAVALPLPVHLPPGTKIEDQLKDGINVGDAVRSALKQTVQHLADEVEVHATRDSKQGNTWTVVDGHRRWKLSAQPEDALKWRSGTVPAQPFDTTGVNLPDLIAALDLKSIPKGAEDKFARLFAVNQKPDFTDYKVTIEPLPLVNGKSWRVRYQFVAQLLIEANRLTLQTAGGVMWRQREYEELTVVEVERDLAKNIVPPLVQKLLASKFSDTSNLSVKADKSGRSGAWTITSGESVMTLNFSPAQLNITSLAYQSGDPDADPIAWPENHNPAAYAKLRGDDVVFPWSLPVDLPLEEVRLFLERARSSRRSLIELTQPVDQSLRDSAVFALEVLGLSKAEATLISAEKTAPAVYDCWGVSPDQKMIWDAAVGGFLKGASPLDLLQKVSILLQQSRLSFEELQAVFATKFVQGGAGPLVIKPANTCKPSEMTVAALTPGHLDRIHRFVRLHRRLGWSEQDLDNAIKIATGAALDDSTLLKLAHLAKLRELLDLPVASILAWYGPAATDDQKRFLLARALGLPIDELKHALALFGIANPFSSSADTLGFCQRVKDVHRSEVAFEDLRYLLQHEKTPGSNTDLDENQLTALAEAISGAVRSIPDAAEKPPPHVPTGSESVEARNARENEAIRITRENEALALATLVARENAVIATLATGLSAASELVDGLLRIRLLHPANPSRAAIDVFLSPLGDFIDVASLIRKLSTHTDPASISAYLWSQFSPADQLLLNNPASTALQQQTILVPVLNRVLQGASIYDPARFIGVTLSAETNALNSVIPAATGADLIRLNRLLLEDAYALEIAQRRSADMLFIAGEVAEPDSDLIKSVLVRLHKSALLCDAVKLSRTDLPLLRRPAIDAYGITVLDFNTLPVTESPAADIAGFEQLLALARLRGIARGAGDMLQQYASLNFADSTAVPWTNVDAVYQVLMTGLTLTKHEVEAAAKQLHITKADQYRNPLLLTRLIQLLAALKQLGTTVDAVSPATATSLTDPNGFVSVSPNEPDAAAARELLRGKYGESQWHDLIKPIADKLRERQRNALVDYLIARDARPRDGDANPQIFTGTRMRDANDLYEYYLIDVQTSSCLKTTRLLQATAAVQLFVQRLLLNLEDGLSLADDKRALWDWMHKYRVWEANRKVFLFPENWLLPELRDDKTVIFRQMESALTENEASAEITRSALLGYLEELVDLAQINVVAMYEDRRLMGEPPSQKLQSTLYVVGRTPNEPYSYFWRSCTKFDDKGMSWSGWEALDLDNANDFIMPFVVGGDLHVAWPIFSKTKDEKDENKLWWQVQIAWMRRTNKGWVKRKISHAQLRVNRLENKDAAGSFVFRLGKADSQVIIGSASNKLLAREVIEIACYSADEATPILTIVLDPELDAFTHTGGDAVDLWNAKLTVNGVFYQYATGDTAENTRKNIPVSGAVVTLFYSSRTSANTFHDVKELTAVCTTNSDGTFNFSIDTQSDDKAGVYRDSTIRLSFMWFDGDLKQFDGPSRVLGPENNHYFKSWTWNVNVGLKNDKLQKFFLPDRQVKYVKAGRFIIESGRDLRLDPQPGLMLPLDPVPSVLTSPANAFVKMSVDGNRFVSTSGGKAVVLGGYQFKVDHDFGPLLEITLSVDASGYKSRLWYVRDASGRYYVRMIATYGLTGSFWKVWPDGQDFAGWYRSIAAASTFALFDPAKQAMTRDGQQALLPAPPAQPDSTSSPMISFERTSPYANYNWELFLHAPLAIADYLASQQRFEDARRWLHAVFDPTTIEKDQKTKVPRFWRFLPFATAAQPAAIAKLLTWLADPRMVDPKDTKTIEDDLSFQIDEWRKNPFMPHLIARLRPSAYQWYTFFAYLDVLIGWGDQLFRRDTRESVNDATLLYVLAAKLLGPRPRTIPAPTPPFALTYRLLQSNPNQLDSFSNAWVNYADLPGVKQLANAQTSNSRSSQSFALLKTSDQPSDQISLPVPDISSAIQHLTSLTAPAFCVPQNEKITEFYDRVESRLFNVRNCRNIEGVFRDLPLYEPPIDPLLLIRARAAGLDLDSVIAGLYAPLPNYRFTFTLQKALELCAELKALGGALLSALEKKDSEELTLLRSRHEITMLKLVRDTRKQQIAEAEANIAALQQSELTILERFGQYQKLLGKPGITKGQDGLPVVEQSSSLSVSTDAVGGASGMGLIRREVEQLVLTDVAHKFTQLANSTNLIAGTLSLIPNIFAGTPFAGQTSGGTNFGIGTTAIAKSIEMVAGEANYLASFASTFAGYERRQDEWVHQSKLALAELKQIQKQIVAAEIRKDIAERELSNHDTQIENAQEVEDFMRSKFTNQQLYRWMSSQIAEVYFRTYQLALDQARRAERAYQHELALDNQTTPFVQSGQWDSLKRGLLAGEHLHHDLKRMESAFLERNVRELEISKHISLLQLDPGALIALKETGACDFDVPEVFFDLDYPGHYMRRIKMVSLSIPCVVGPYASVSATLRLTKNAIRFNPQVDAAADSYTRKRTASEDDPRFRETAATIKAIVTSSAQQDSGMFEPNLRDERFLPFEGAGAISTWHLELPTQFESFDYDTISDVVLHLRYTARDAGDSLKTPVVAQLSSALDQIVTGTAAATAAGNPGLARLFSMRHEFPTEWYSFLNPIETKNGQTLEFELKQDRFPFLFRGRTIQIHRMDIFLKFKDVRVTELPSKPLVLVVYQSSAPLTVDLIPPGATPIPKVPPPQPPPPPKPQLDSDVLILNGLPHASKDFVQHFDGARDLGNWSLAIEEAAINSIDPSLRTTITAGNVNHSRLKASVIQDLFIVCRYSIVVS
jgi:hypothetical protein